jgi:sugar porter (SP) family MFS transporter
MLTLIIGIVFSIFNIAQIVCAPLLWIHDVWGRKCGIIVGCVGVIVGAIVTATTKSLSVFIGGRFMLSFFATLSITAAPLYVVEMSPPHMRGTVAGLYNTLFYLGSIMATFAIYGTELHYKDNPLSWKIPLWLQIVCPGIVICGALFIPESPRYLVATDRYEKARKVIVDFHANGDENHPLVELEMAEMVESFRDVGLTNWKTVLDFRSLVATRATRYRTLLVILMAWFAQFSGNAVASYYLPTMLKEVGVTSVNVQLLLNAIYAITGWAAAISGARCHDIFGRRKMLLSTTLAMAVCLAVVAATTSTYIKTGSKAASDATILFIYVFGATYAFGFTAMTPIYPSEVLSNDLRAKGFCVYKIASGASAFINAFVAPIAMNNIKYWFYVFFVFWDLIEFACIYFLFVETKGRTLEELEEIFEAPNPVKASVQVKSSMPAVEYD